MQDGSDGTRWCIPIAPGKTWAGPSNHFLTARAAAGTDG